MAAAMLQAFKIQCGRISRFHAHVGLAAERTDRTGMDAGAAVRAALFKHFAADRAESAEHRIAFFAFRARENPALNFIALVRRTIGVGAKAAFPGVANRRANDRLDFFGSFGRRQFQAELLRYLSNHFVVEFRAVAIFEHRKSRLLAADFLRERTLRNATRAPLIPHLYAKFSAKICHGPYYPLFSFPFQGGSYKQLSTVLSTYKHLLIKLLITPVHGAVERNGGFLVRETAFTFWIGEFLDMIDKIFETNCCNMDAI